MNEASLQELLNFGKRPILVEFDPPRQAAPTAFLPCARELAEAGADLITIADCPVGRANIDACMLAAKMKRAYAATSVIPKFFSLLIVIPHN